MSLPLVLLPGMMCDARLFGPQIAEFSRDRAVQVAPITGADTVEALAAEILLHAPPRFALAGLSMGGIVAMEVVRQAPERVAGLALLGTNPKAEADKIRALRRPQMERVRQGELVAVMRDEMKPNYLAPGAGREDVLALCMEMAESLGPDVFLRQSQALMDRPDQCDALRAYGGPALVLCGSDDALCPVFRHELMRDLLSRPRLVVIEGAGHLPTLERSKETIAALRDWLKETDDE
ncbi:alpha/beta fold hydrolase [Palleronia caenipelagi]|uniref:Alpha/beta fold hydrolase n=1 Tax=Palleronia caenipelagi TaxID=2489174 RepID=A0A547Q6L5_9RHOB|nr:alpha/beta hydrolase [Palleronia caenipelagi]TRD22019.1 alpha/beta fold hydrolase [Palleronia caenipelagi]